MINTYYFLKPTLVVLSVISGTVNSMHNPSRIVEADIVAYPTNPSTHTLHSQSRFNICEHRKYSGCQHFCIPSRGVTEHGEANYWVDEEQGIPHDGNNSGMESGTTGRKATRAGRTSETVVKRVPPSHLHDGSPFGLQSNLRHYRHRCACAPGYKLGSDGRSCALLDPCNDAYHPHGCDHICSPLPSLASPFSSTTGPLSEVVVGGVRRVDGREGYRCMCYLGWELQLDGRRCVRLSSQNLYEGEGGAGLIRVKDDTPATTTITSSSTKAERKKKRREENARERAERQEEKKQWTIEHRQGRIERREELEEQRQYENQQRRGELGKEP